MKQKILLVLERENASDKLWGRVTFKDELIVSSASSYSDLIADIEQKLVKHHNVDIEHIEFDVAYDLTALFKEKSFLILSAVADRLGMNRSLLAQYAAGVKFPSLKTAIRVGQVIRDFGNELCSIRIATKGMPAEIIQLEEFSEMELVQLEPC